MLKRLFEARIRIKKDRKHDPLTLEPPIKRLLHASCIYYKPKNHYETLELTPKATQAQIKAAYYRLSMLHHPDKSQGQIDTVIRFQALTEAYETLSNVDKRRNYDRGIMVHSSMKGDAGARGASQEGIIRRTRQQSFGRSEHYNFDEFYKMHYGSTLRKRQAVKMEYEQFVREKAQKREPFSVVTIMLGAIMVLIFVMSMSPNPYDKPPTSERDPKSSD